MAKRPWFDEIQKRLVQEDLPPEYIQRLLDELTDHFQDIEEKNMSTEANVELQMGEPERVADAAAEAYKRASYSHRHPFVTFLIFGVSPLVVMIASIVLIAVGIAEICGICRDCGINITDENHFGGIDPTALSWALGLITVIVPAALLTIVYCRFARRLGLKRKWMIASFAVVAFVSMLPTHGLVLSGVPGASRWIVGVSVPPGLLQCVQLIVPLAIGIWLMQRFRGHKALGYPNNMPA
jgi:hypothetical protein